MKRQRRRARGGFSLAECLVTLLILSLMSALACSGISNALQDRARAIRVADAQTVAATAAQAVADQIRYGQIARVEDTGVVLDSGTYGPGVRLELDDGHLVARRVSAAGTAPYALLGEMAYSGLTLDELTFRADLDGDRVKSVQVDLSVCATPGEPLWSLTYTVTPLNPRLTAGI